MIGRGRGLVGHGTGLTEHNRGLTRRGLTRRGGRLRAAGADRRARRELRPARSLLPRRSPLLRSALVAALLALAAGVLWLPPSAKEPTSSGPAPGDVAASVAGTVSVDAEASPGALAEQGWPSAADRPAWAGSASGGSGPASAGSKDASSGAGPALPAGTVGVPVRITEPATLAVVRPGARIDLMLVPAADGRAPMPTVVAAGALVLDVVGADGTLDGRGALYLALSPEQAHRVVAAPPEARFAFVVRS